MARFSERLRFLRETSGISQSEFGKRIGVSKSSINMYERGEREPGIETLEAMADYFNVDMDYLIGKSKHRNKTEWLATLDYDTNSSKNYYAPNTTEDYVTFPVFGEIAAGYDNLPIEDWEGELIDIPTSYLNGRKPNEFLVLCVKGDSMYPLYHAGDKVLILKQETMDYSGQVGAVIYDDDYTSLKKVEYKIGENWMRLVPINPNHCTITIKDEQLDHCRIIGIPKLLIRHISE